MRTTDQALHGIYRCPVCGHRDSVDVNVSGPAQRVSCSYCETHLEVSARNPGVMLLSAQLAEAPLQG